MTESAETFEADPNAFQEGISEMPPASQAVNEPGETAVGTTAAKCAEQTVPGGSPPPSGRRIEHYELLEELGSGAMGSVYRARDSRLDREVALKLSAIEAQSGLNFERVRREGEHTAQVRHPNVVSVFDTGTTDDGAVFMVMELLRGEPLSRRMSTERRLDAVTAIRIMLPAIAGLGAAHENGVFHRDVKPDNIFLSRDGGRIVPKIVDFGVAKREDSGLALTQAGIVLGTPLYMSPEQINNPASASSASDLWSVCAIIYEMIAGRPPFISDNLKELFGQILTAKPPEISRELVDRRLWKIIERGLRKSPSERFSSAADLGGELARWLRDAGYDEDISEEPVAGWLSPESGMRRSQPSLSSYTRQGYYRLRRRFEPIVVERLKFGGSRLAWAAAAVLTLGTTAFAYGNRSVSHVAGTSPSPNSAVSTSPEFPAMVLPERAPQSSDAAEELPPKEARYETRNVQEPRQQVGQSEKKTPSDTSAARHRNTPAPPASQVTAQPISKSRKHESQSDPQLDPTWGF